MTVYLDTSVALRVLFGQRPRLRLWNRWDEAWTSELFGVESRRAIDRLRLDGALDDAGVATAQESLARIEGAIGLVPVSRAVLRRASLPMATSVRTLDAIHLATALLLRERLGRDVVFATHDDRQHLAARALGFDSRGV